MTIDPFTDTFTTEVWIEPISRDPSVDEPVRFWGTSLFPNPTNSGSDFEAINGRVIQQSAFEPQGDGTTRISVEAIYE